MDACGVGGGGNADVLLVSFGALVTLHGYAVRRVSLKSWLHLFSLKAGVLFRMMAKNGTQNGRECRVLVFI